MEIAPLNLNNARQGVNFKGKTPNIDDLRAIKRFANCSLDGLEKSLIESIKRKAPGLIQTLDGEKYIPDDRITKRIISGFKSFFGMPMDAIDSIARKFPDSKLNNAEFLKKYRASVQLDNEVRALQGIHKNTLDFVQDVMPEGDRKSVV